MTITLNGSAPLFEVFDMPTSFAFYRDAIGFEIVATNKEIDTDPAHVAWAWLRLNDVDLMLNTAYEEEERPPERDPSLVFGRGMCFYVGCPDVDSAYEHLRARGIDVKPPKLAKYGMKQLHVRDPDGYSLCFQWRG